jgi:CBS domain containing-hemolysin-like protein
MSVAAAVVLLAVAVAAVCALADGALRAAAPHRPGEEPPSLGGTPERERMHRALSFARLLAFTTAGAAAAVALRLDIRAHAAAAALGAAAAVAVVFAAESCARAAGDALGAAALAAVYPVVRAIEWLLAPAVALGARIDRGLQRLLPPSPPSDEEREASEEQFRQVVAAEAEVTRDERELLRGAFSLGDTAVREIMVPRVDVVGVERTTPWSEVVDRVRSSEHARFPTYDGTLDEVVGILYAKDLLPAVIAGEPPPDGWLGLVRPATFIPQSKTIDAQLRDFKASGSHIAVVVDEYGGTAGIVTIEDILEEIVGEIRDEYDEEEAEFESDDDRRYWVSARMTLDELSTRLHHDFEHDQVTTVGGLIYELLGRVPRAGESLAVDGFRVVVERVRRRRIERVYFERVETLAPQEAE